LPLLVGLSFFTTETTAHMHSELANTASRSLWRGGISQVSKPPSPTPSSEMPEPSFHSALVRRMPPSSRERWGSTTHPFWFRNATIACRLHWWL